MINEIQPKIKFQNIVQCPFKYRGTKVKSEDTRGNGFDDFTYIHTYLIYIAQILTKRSQRLYKLLPNAGRNTCTKNTKTKKKLNAMRKKLCFEKFFENSKCSSFSGGNRKHIPQARCNDKKGFSANSSPVETCQYRKVLFFLCTDLL